MPRESREEVFARCQKAAADPAHHVLVAHMWEYWQGKHNDIDKAGFRAREEEISSILGVMANEKGAIYTDRGFLHTDPKAPMPLARLDHFGSRHQKGTPRGIIGVATSPIASGMDIPLFDRNSRTGLLMIDPDPVCVMPHDGWSAYYDSPKGIPNQSGWDEVTHFLTANTPHRFIDCFAHFGFKDHPEAREELVGKLAIMRRIQSHPLDFITESQMPNNSKELCTLLDPQSPTVLQKAKEAYPTLIENIKKQPPDVIAMFKHPEVDVNSTLDKVAGIVAYNATPDHPFLPEKSLTENLKDNLDLTKTLYRAINECNQVEGMFRKHHIQRQPTIVIYQSKAQGPNLVHVEPTPELRRIVEGILRKQGELKSLDALPALGASRF